MALKIKLQARKKEGAATVTLTGVLDNETYQDFEKQMQALITPAIKGLILDMKGLTYISSAGFASIFRARQALEKNSAALAIANLQPNVKRVFEALKVIPESLFATLEGADQYLDKYIAFINSKKEP